MVEYRNRDMSMKEYLEELVDLHKQQQRLKNFDENLGICLGAECVHLSKGIQDLAKIVDATIEIETSESAGIKYLHFSFIYKNVRFVQVGTKKEWEEHKNVCM